MVHDAVTLKGRTIALTRPCGQIEETGDLVKRYDGQPYFLPLIEIKPVRDLSAVKAFFSELESHQVDYVLFMSVNGIQFLFRYAEKLEYGSQLRENLNDVVVVAVGPKTAQQLKKCGVTASLVPKEYSSTGLLQYFSQENVSGKSVWIPRTSSAGPTLVASLKEFGANVHELYVYESLLPTCQDSYNQFLEDLKQNKIDAIIFGSSLSATNLFKMFDNVVPKENLRKLMNDTLTIVAIGPITAKTLRELGLHVDVIPNNYLFDEAIKKLSEHWTQ